MHAQSRLLEEMIGGAWAAALPGATIRPGSTWEDCGADAGATARLMQRLEQGLGRPVPYDAVSSDMTVASLAQRLSAEQLPATQPSRLPRLFVFTDTDGNLPAAARLGRTTGGSFTVELFDMSNLALPTHVLTSVSAAATVMAGRIQSIQPTGELRLIGYGFGGLIAFEAARQLVAAHRSITFLGLVDTVLARPRRIVPVAPADVPGASRAFRHRAARALLSSRAFRSMHRLALRADRLAGAPGAVFGQQVRHRLSDEARHRYRPGAYAGPTHLWISDDEAVAAWVNICPQLTVLTSSDRMEDFVRAGIDPHAHQGAAG